MKLIIEIPEEYASAIVVTAIGTEDMCTNITVFASELTDKALEESSATTAIKAKVVGE